MGYSSAGMFRNEGQCVADVERLVTAFQEMREGSGITTNKLADHRWRWLLDLLLTPDDPNAAITLLRSLAESIADPALAEVAKLPVRKGRDATHVSKTVRIALALGNDDEGNDLRSRGSTEERRQWAYGPGLEKGQAFLGLSRSTQWRIENEEGFPALARLILDRHARLTADPTHQNEPMEGLEPDLFAQAEPIRLDEDDQDTTAAQPDPQARPAPSTHPNPLVRLWQDLRSVFGRRPLPATEREYLTQFALWSGSLVALAAVVTLVVTGVIPLHTKNSPDKVTSASAPGSAKVTSTPQIDNTRGWGPARKTFTMGHPATYPVLNSITDNPQQGDERNFVQCKDAAKGNETYADELVAQDHHTYDCYVWIENDIAPNLDSIASPDVGGNLAAKLQDARLRVWFPENHTYNPGLTVILSASNTNPSEVWDSCNFVAARPVSLRYVLGSARLHTNGTPNNVGAPLPGAEDAPIHDKGTLLGDTGDGLIGQHGGFVIFQMSVTLG